MISSLLVLDFLELLSPIAQNVWANNALSLTNVHILEAMSIVRT